MYLNDNFEGGCTTFFLPSAQHGIIEARPVSPRQGAVCVFPHGSAENSLLHEVSSFIFFEVVITDCYLCNRAAESSMGRNM